LQISDDESSGGVHIVRAAPHFRNSLQTAPLLVLRAVKATGINAAPRSERPHKSKRSRGSATTTIRPGKKTFAKKQITLRSQKFRRER